MKPWKASVGVADLRLVVWGLGAGGSVKGGVSHLLRAAAFDLFFIFLCAGNVYRANRNEPELTAVICDSNEIYREDWTSGGATLLSVMISSGQRAVAHLVCAVLTPWCSLCRRVCTTQGKAST